MKRFIVSCCRQAFVVPAVFLWMVLGGNAEAQKYVRVTSADVLFDGAECILVCENEGKAMKTGASNSKYRDAVNVTIDRSTTPYSISIGAEEVSVITLEQATGGWYLHNVDLDKNGYLYVSTSGTDLNTGVNSNRAVWTISPSSTETTITNSSNSGRKIKYSTSNSRFAYYSNSDNTSLAVQLYMKEVVCEEPSALDYMAEDDLAMLYWEAPENGVPNGYEITYQRKVTGSSPVSVLTQETDITLENLIPGTYTWSVRSKCGANTYSEAVQGEAFEIEAPATPYVSPVMNESYTVEGTQTLNKPLSFNAGNLTGNLSVSVKAETSSNGGQAVLQVSPSTISKADAEAEGGFTITLTTGILDFDLYEDTLIFSDGGNILNKSVFMIEAVPAQSVLLAESFNGCTGTNELYSPITKADNPDWTGSKIFADNGAVRVGSSGTNGTLTSPTLDLRLQHGAYTVVFFAKSHSATEGKSLQVTSTTENGSNLTRDFTLTTEYDRYETTFENGAASTTLTFQPKSGTTGRFYLDSVAVYQIAEPSLSVKPISHIIYKNTEEDENGSTRHDTLSVRGAVLQQNVTVSCTNDRFEFSPSLLDAEAVMSAEGAKIYLTYNGTQEKDTAILRLVSGKVRDSVLVYAERFVKKLPVQYSKPTVKPNGGIHDDSVRVIITTSVNDAEIRYTLDGTLPTEASTRYTDTFTLRESAVLKAAVFHPEYTVTEASVQEVSFTIRHLTPAPLPFDFTGGVSDIRLDQGMKQEGLGSDYAAPCRLKFDNAGDYLLLVLASAPDSLYFDIKGNSTSGNYVFKVEASSDASAWTALKTYAGSGLKDGAVTEEAMPLDKEVRYIRWTYETKDKGNVGLGNIHVTKPITDPTLWLSPRVATIPAVMEGTDTVAVRVTGAVLHQNLSVRLARNDRNAFRLAETSLDKDLVMNRRVGVNLHVVYTAQNAKGVDTALVYIESDEIRDSVRICASTAAVSASCEKPENLETVSVSANSATITFDRYIGMDYQYQFSKNQNDWSTPVTISSAAVNLEGLTPTTVYYVRLRTICSETEVSAWCAPLRFSTKAPENPDNPDPDDPDPDDPDPDDPDPDVPTDNEDASWAGVKIYPNPSHGEFYIELAESTLVEIYNASGLRILSETMAEGKHTLALRTNGVHFVRLTTATATVYKRIVVL